MGVASSEKPKTSGVGTDIATSNMASSSSSSSSSSAKNKSTYLSRKGPSLSGRHARTKIPATYEELGEDDKLLLRLRDQAGRSFVEIARDRDLLRDVSFETRVFYHSTYKVLLHIGYHLLFPTLKLFFPLELRPLVLVIFFFDN